MDDEESEIGLRGVAAGVYDQMGSMIVAVSLGGPTTRVTSEVHPEFIRAIREAAATISCRLGHRATPELQFVIDKARNEVRPP